MKKIKKNVELCFGLIINHYDNAFCHEVVLPFRLFYLSLQSLKTFCIISQEQKK